MTSQNTTITLEEAQNRAKDGADNQFKEMILKVV